MTYYNNKKVFTWPIQYSNSVNSSYYLKTMNFVSENALNMSTNMYGPISQVWVANITLPPLVDDDYRNLAPLLSRLEGGVSYVKIVDPKRCFPRGDGAGSRTPATTVKWKFTDTKKFTDITQFVDVGIQYDDGRAFCNVLADVGFGEDFVSLRGLLPSKQYSLRMGDLLEIRERLYEVMGDSPSDTNGYTTVSIRPRLREALVAGDTVRLFYPAATFQLVNSDDHFDRGMVVSNLSISFVEKAI